MLTRPSVRSVPLSTSASTAASERQRLGDKNGRMPSITSTKLSAVAISFHMFLGSRAITLPISVARREKAGRPRPRRECSRELPPLLLQVLQELAVRIEDEQVALVAEHLRVRVDAAVE